MRKTLAIFVASVLLASSFTLSSCKRCGKKENEPNKAPSYDNITGSTDKKSGDGDTSGCSKLPTPTDKKGGDGDTSGGTKLPTPTLKVLSSWEIERLRDVMEKAIYDAVYGYHNMSSFLCVSEVARGALAKAYPNADVNIINYILFDIDKDGHLDLKRFDKIKYDDGKWLGYILNAYYNRLLCAESLYKQCETGNIPSWKNNDVKKHRDRAEEFKKYADQFKGKAYTRIAQIKGDSLPNITLTILDGESENDRNDRQNKLIEKWDELQPHIVPADDAWNRMIGAVDKFLEALDEFEALTRHQN
jgi:hypothetical protein